MGDYDEEAFSGRLCRHHTEHTEECGYVEGVAGSPCSHVHTKDCYVHENICVHEHTDECYTSASGTGVKSVASPSNASRPGKLSCSHVCTEEDGCFSDILNCIHENHPEGYGDEMGGGAYSCGYTPDSPAQPCTYVCDICAVQAYGALVGTPSEANRQECICTEPCTDENINEDCPICGAEDAILADCLKVNIATMSVALRATSVTRTEYDEVNKNIVTNIEDLALKHEGDLAGDVGSTSDYKNSFPVYQMWTKNKGSKLYLNNTLYRVLRYDENKGVLIESDAYNAERATWYNQSMSPYTGIINICKNYYGELSKTDEVRPVKKMQLEELNYTFEKTDFDGINNNHWMKTNENLTDIKQIPESQTSWTYVPFENVFILGASEVAGCYGSMGDWRKQSGETMALLRTRDSSGRPMTLHSNNGVKEQAQMVNYSGVDFSYAMNLDPDEIMFLTKGNVAKPTRLEANTDNNTRIWKITAKGSGDFSTGATISINSGQVTVTHNPLSQFSGYNHITARIEDSSGETLYYGSINTSTTKTETQFSLPSLSNGSYELYVYAEKWNGNTATDLATAPAQYSFRVTDSGTQQNLTFTDRDSFDIPAGLVSTAIDSVDVSDAVQGGTKPYTYSIASDWLQIGTDSGIITGTRPGAETPATTAEVTVTDSSSPAQSKTITINVGAVTAAPQTYTITFDYNYDGSPGQKQLVTNTDGRLASLPADTERDGWMFTGWFTERTGGEQVSEDKVYTGNQTLYAQWSPIDSSQFIITFDADGGSVSPQTMQTSGNKLAGLPEPKRTGYTFIGWFTEKVGGRRVGEDEVYSANTTLYAHWDGGVPVEYKVSFNANGGSVSPLEVSTTNGRLASMPTPIRAGYRFKGWFTALISGVKVNPSREYTSDTTLYAHWEEIVYSGGGSSGGGYSDSDGSDSSSSGSRPSGGSSGGGSSSKSPSGSSATHAVAVGTYSPASTVAVYKSSDSGVNTTWTLDTKGWRLQQDNSAFKQSSWAYASWQGHGEWYLFGSDGYMLTGWQTYNGRTYYLHALSDGTQGRMYTGWHNIDGVDYYFSEANDSTLGALQTNMTARK